LLLLRLFGAQLPVLWAFYPEAPAALQRQIGYIRRQFYLL
jgi:hypothetical protein